MADAETMADLLMFSQLAEYHSRRLQLKAFGSRQGQDDENLSPRLCIDAAAALTAAMAVAPTMTVIDK
jgi:hypothetical protein